MEWLVVGCVRGGVIHLLGGETSLLYALLGGFIAILVVHWVMVRIRAFGRMFGWEVCRYVIDIIGCMIYLC